MATYTVMYWAEHNDQSTDFEVTVEAVSEEQAIELTKTSSRTARRGKYFQII